MSEVVSNEFEMRNAMEESMEDLGKAMFALSEILNGYWYAKEPTLKKAQSYGCGEDTSKEAEQSFSYMIGYNKIITLTRMALDYCSNASKILEGGAEQ